MQNEDQPPVNPPSPPPPGLPEPPKPALPALPPPAAKIVLEGSKTEREAALEKDLRGMQTRVAELEDQNRQLKTIPKATTPQKKSWLEDGTIID